MARSLPKKVIREKTMTRTKIFAAIFATALSVIALPAIASAQYGQYGQYDPYTRGGYGNSGYYGNNGNMRSTLRDLKQRARQLERQIDRELDRGRINGSYREDQINRLASSFKDAVNNLDSSYYNRNDNEVRRVMGTASQLDRAISRSGMSYNVMNQWQAIRNDLRLLGLNYGGGGRYPSGGYGNGGYNNGGYNRPSWWPF